jgi:hypothetical protein
MQIYIYLAAVLGLLAAGGVCFKLLRKLMNPEVSSEDMNAWIELRWQNWRPLERLLDPNEFEFLRRQGLDKARINELHAKRRTLFRMYLRRLTHEFNTAHSALQLLMVHSDCDRPDLAQMLATQRIQFYRGLLGVEFRLALNAGGFETVPSLDLIRPLETLRNEFCRLAPVTSAMSA